MTAEASGNRVDVHGTATAGNGPIHLAVDARLDRPEILAAALPAEWRPSGSLVVSGTLDGSPADPRVAARISGSGLDANGIAIDSLEGDVTFAQGILNVTGLRLNRGDGWLRLEADIDRRLERMRISGRGEKLAVSVRTLSGTSLSPVGGARPRRRLYTSMTPPSNSMSPARPDNRRERSRSLLATSPSTVARSGGSS